jgi:hypothetical protein
MQESTGNCNGYTVNVIMLLGNHNVNYVDNNSSTFSDNNTKL